MAKNHVGDILWCDLTVENAGEVKDFYQSVIGWRPNPVSMGDYDDFVMNTPTGDKAVSGVCHARGVNADLPAQWLMYFGVENIEEALTEVERKGGKALTKVKGVGKNDKYAVIQDPAGAICALYEPG